MHSSGSWGDVVRARDAVARAWSQTGIESRTGVAELSWPEADPAMVGLVRSFDSAADAAERRRAAWCLLVAASGALPGLDDLDDAVLALATGGAVELLAATTASPALTRELTLVSGALVDVTITAHSTNLAGVPRVVRQLVHAWGEPDDVTYVVWEDDGLRTLTAPERARLGLGEALAPGRPAPGSFLLPGDALLAVVEILRPEAHAIAVEAMVAAGVLELRALLYDLASILEPHPDATRGPFLHHLAALSRASRVVSISDSVDQDARDYFGMLHRNGRSLPALESLPLPNSLPDDEATAPALEPLPDLVVAGDLPLVLVVSSLHRRKNHGRLVQACELLWRAGVEFRLVVVEGTGSKLPRLSAATARLIERGRPLTILNHVSQGLLQSLYRSATVSAYVSLAEGYGLPIVESLSEGTPVISSAVGSMRELGEQGGVILVDPRDVHAIADGLRAVLTDPVRRAELAEQARDRSLSAWPRYCARAGASLGVLPAAESLEG